MGMINKTLQEELSIQAAFGLLLLKNKIIASNSCRKKKSKFQNAMLKEIYSITDYPTQSTKFDISIMLNLSLRAVNVWFQNERQADRIQLNQSNLLSKKLRVDVCVQTLFEIYKNVRKELKII